MVLEDGGVDVVVVDVDDDEERINTVNKIIEISRRINHNPAGVPIWEHGKKRFAKKIAAGKRLIKKHNINLHRFQDMQ